MNKKSILALTVAGIGALATAAIFTKHNQINKEDEQKIKESTEYLESKGYVISRNGFPINGFDFLSVSSLPTFYKVAKTVAKYVL